MKPRHAGPVLPADRARRALVAEGALSRLSFGVVGFALPLYAAQLGLSLPAVGALIAANTAVALALKPVAGVLADRVGSRRSLLLAMVLRSALCGLYSLAATPVHLVAVRCLHGVADSARDPAVAVLVSSAGGRSGVARSFAWYQTAKTSAGAGGKALAGVLITVTGARYGVVFGVAAVLSLLPVLLVARYVHEPVSSAGRAQARPARPPGPACGSPATAPAPGRRLGPAVVLGLLVSATSSSLSSLFPLLATSYAGLTPAQAGALYLLTPVLAFAGPGFGWLADRVSRPGVLAFRGAANLVSSLLYLLAPDLGGFVTGKALDDLGKAAFRPAWGSLLSELADDRPGQRARAMAWLTVGEDAGDVLAPVLAGLVWHWWGVVPLLVGRAVLSAAAEVQGWYVERGLRGTAPHARPARGRARSRGGTGPHDRSSWRPVA